MDTTAQRDLIKRINAFSQSCNKTAFLELGATLGLCLALCALMVWGVTLGGWGYLTLLALPLAGILQTRIFTIQHDCGHGAYFTSKFLNDRVGEALGVLTWTPYHYWRRTHSAHHAYSGNLDHRGIGDVDTLTVKEYNALPLLKRAYYRLYRHPVFILLGAPVLLFGLKHRLPLDNPYHSFKTWTSIMLTNAGIAALVLMILYFLGLKALLLVYVPVCLLGSMFGVAGFYIQHQYEDAYWQGGDDWSYFNAGFHGSSYFEFPKVVNWLVNHINLHHIHHLSFRVPSYRLRACFEAIPELQNVPKRTLRDAPKCFTLALWDEDNKKMVGFAKRV